MTRQFSIIVATVALIPPVFLATGARASDNAQIHRCIGTHGEMMFSESACATPAVRDDRHDPAFVAGAAANAACMRTEIDLLERLSTAMARHDANSLAAMLRWQSVGADEATHRMRELNELVAQPLLAIDNDTEARSVSSPATPNGKAIRVRSGSAIAAGVREHAFAIESVDGCLWLTW